MNDDPLTTAATCLADILKAENTALLAMDFAIAGKLLEAKRAATAALAAAQAGTLHAPTGMRALTERLTELADENRKLLERAIAVQRRVIGTVAQAAHAARPEPQYGPGGALAARSSSPLALSANA